jgi:transcriptional regulator with XRE-family HTH domain
MASPRTLAQARRVVDRLHRVLGEDAQRLREDAGLTRAALGDAAGVDPTYLARLEDGLVNPSLETYARLSVALGADLGAHYYPNTGPAIRDRHQARILEWLLEQLHPRWSTFIEVAVQRPARGWIDLVLHDPEAASVVIAELESTLGRLEQMIRWSEAKAESLPSWEGYPHLGPIRSTSRLLLVRSTRSTRSIGREFARQLAVAFPAHPEDAIAALTGNRPWPGSARIWIDMRPTAIRFIERR